MNIQVINPIEYPGWDKLLETHHASTFFHTSAWAKVLCESYKYKPFYFTSTRSKALSALIPVIEVNSVLTGKRGVSLPFTDACEPFSENLTHFPSIFEKVIQYGIKAGWRQIEIRGGEKYFNKEPASSFYLTHSLNLNKKDQHKFYAFRDSTKRNIKRAEKEGINVRTFNTFDSVKDFYQLNCLTRKRHGLPPQPWIFFQKLYEHVILPKKGSVFLASYHNKVIAGAVYVHFAGKAIYKYGASNLLYQKFRPNNLIMWEAIKWYARNGFKIFSFGRTEPDNHGLLQFKRGWGTKEEKISYYSYHLKTLGFVIKNNRISGRYHVALNKLPVPLLKFIGFALYRHMG